MTVLVKPFELGKGLNIILVLHSTLVTTVAASACINSDTAWLGLDLIRLSNTRLRLTGLPGTRGPGTRGRLQGYRVHTRRDSRTDFYLE